MTPILIAGSSSSTHALYHEWDVFYLLAVLLPIFIGAVGWIVRTSINDTNSDRLHLHSLLTSVVQRVVIKEVEQIIKRVDEYLPHELAKSGGVEGQSRFDRLVLQLQEIDLDDPEAGHYPQILQDALAGALVNQAKKLLNNARRDIDKEESRSDFRVSLTADQNTIFAIANIAKQIEGMEDKFEFGQRHTKWVAPLTCLSILPILGGLLYPGDIGFSVVVISIAAFFLLWSVTILLVARSYRGHQWLEEKAESYTSGKNLIRDLSDRDHAVPDL